MLNVALVYGGYSHEKVISVKSADTIFNNLSSDKYKVYRIIIDEKGWHCQHETGQIEVNKNDFSVTIDNDHVCFDFAYITIHGTPGEDGLLQAYFDLLSIPYNTPKHLASTITFNKWACNQLLKSEGINCADSVLLRSETDLDPKTISHQLGMPCFVKPNDGGSSFGTSKVEKASELPTAVKNAFEHGKEVIIESCLTGTEVTCGSYFNGTEIIVLPITEIRTNNDFFDFEAKYEGASKEITPAEISRYSANKIQELNKKIYHLLDLNGVVRVDYIIVDNEPFVLEVNTTPGMSLQSVIPQQAEVANIELDAMFDQIIINSLLKSRSTPIKN